MFIFFWLFLRQRVIYSKAVLIFFSKSWDEKIKEYKLQMLGMSKLCEVSKLVIL